jgi:hypothetical protein
MLNVVMRRVIVLTVIMSSVSFAQHHNYLNVMLSVIMLSVIMLSVFMLSVIMLSVFMLSVIMLTVVVPRCCPQKSSTFIFNLFQIYV